MIGVLIGLLINLPFCAWDLFHDVRRTGVLPTSRFYVFKEVHMRMTQEQVEEILRSHEVRCEHPRGSLAQAASCTFTDFWREYKIRFNHLGVVIEKSYSFRHSPLRY